MSHLIDFYLNYIVTLWLGNELLALGMNGPDRGWVNYTGRDFAGNNPNPAPTAPEIGTSYTQDNKGRWIIKDPDGICVKTKGLFIRGYDYGESVFFKNAYAFLSEKRNTSEIPAGLHPRQAALLETMRGYHFVHVENRTGFDPNVHLYNTKSYRERVKHFKGNTN